MVAFCRSDAAAVNDPATGGRRGAVTASRFGTDRCGPAREDCTRALSLRPCEKQEGDAAHRDYQDDRGGPAAPGQVLQVGVADLCELAQTEHLEAPDRDDRGDDDRGDDGGLRCRHVHQSHLLLDGLSSTSTAPTQERARICERYYQQ